MQLLHIYNLKMLKYVTGILILLEILSEWYVYYMSRYYVYALCF